MSDKLVGGCKSEGVQSQVKQRKPPVKLNIVTVNPVELPELSIVLDEIVFKNLFDTGGLCSFISFSIYKKHFSYEIFEVCSSFCAEASLCEERGYCLDSGMSLKKTVW